MPLSTVLGHKSAIAGLRAAWKADRVSHAYLFLGPEGVGKSLVASEFVQLLSCTDPQEPGDACGRCRACRLIGDGRHPDLISVEPDGRFIKIAQVREVTKVLRFPPVEAAWRAVILHEADRLHEAAANALLKTLEEPSQRNVFVLISAQPHALLPTIRSRCQDVRFTALDRATVASWVERNKELDATTASEVAAMSGGSIGRAAELTDPAFLQLRDRWLEALTELATLPPDRILDLANTMASDKKLMPTVLDVLRIGLRDVMLRAAGLGHAALTFPQRANRMPVLDTGTAVASLRLIDEVEDATRFNANPRMVAERLLLGLSRSFAASMRGRR